MGTLTGIQTLTMSRLHLSTSRTETTIRNRNYESHKNSTKLCADTNLKNCSRKIVCCDYPTNTHIKRQNTQRQKKAIQTDDLNQDNRAKIRKKKLPKESENIYTHSFTCITESFCYILRHNTKLIMHQYKLIFKNTHRNYPCCF